LEVPKRRPTATSQFPTKELLSVKLIVLHHALFPGQKQKFSTLPRPWVSPWVMFQQMCSQLTFLWPFQRRRTRRPPRSRPRLTPLGMSLPWLPTLSSTLPHCGVHRIWGVRPALCRVHQWGWKFTLLLLDDEQQRWRGAWIGCRQLQTACLHECIWHCFPWRSVRLPQMLERCSDPQPMKTGSWTGRRESKNLFFLLSQIFQFLFLLLFSLKTYVLLKFTNAINAMALCASIKDEIMSHYLLCISPLSYDHILIIR